MSAPIPLRQDFDASQLRGLAKKTKDGPQARRLLALAAIYDGAMRTEAAKIGGVGRQIIRDWAFWFNAHGPDGLRNGKSPGQPCKLNDAQRLAIVRMIESGPIPAVYGVVRWRLIDLAQWIFEEFRDHDRQADAQPGAARHGLPQALARPRHYAQAAGAIEDFKKASPRAWTQSRARRRSTATR
jgi:transposase